MSVNNENSIYQKGVSMSQVNSAISEATSELATGYTPKGEASVSTLNGMSTQENGWLYTLTDSGTLTDGSLAVSAGDNVAWDATNSVWYKAMNYAPAQYGTNEVKNLPVKTSFASGDKILVAGTAPGSMDKDVLLRVTADNSYPDNIKAEIDGNDNTFITYDLHIRYGVEYCLIPSTLDWEVATNSYGYAVIGFAIYYVDENNTSQRVSGTEIYIGNGSSALEKPLDSEYLFTIPANAKRAYIGCRAKVGTTVTFNVSPSMPRSEESVTNIRAALPASAVGNEYYEVRFDYAGKKGLYNFSITSDVDSPNDNLNGLYFRLHDPATSSWKTIIPSGSASWTIELVVDFDFDKIMLKFLRVTTVASYVTCITSLSDQKFCMRLNSEVSDIQTHLQDEKVLGFPISITGQGQTQVSYDITNKVQKGCDYRVVPKNTTWQIATNTEAWEVNGFVIRSQKNGVNTDYVNIKIPAGQNHLQQPLENEYIVHVPEDCDAFMINLRADTDVVVDFDIYISTYSEDRKVSINEMYPKEEFLPKIGTLKMKKTPAGWDPKNTPVVLLWFSDIHGDVNNVKRIIEFKHNYSNMIDDVLNTGDSVTDNLGDYSFYQQMLAAGADKFLVAVGNHDVTSTNYTSYKGWSGNTPISEIYSKFVGEMDVQGVVLAGVDKNYYYKDYTAGAVNTKGVRLIVLDSSIQASSLAASGSGVSPAETEAYTAAQLSWFETVLSDAKSNDLAVVVAAHGVEAGDDFASHLGFTNLDNVVHSVGAFLDEDFLDAVDTFITGGGEFICWLCGHQHSDHIADVTGHPDQTQILITTGTSRAYYSKKSQPYRTGYNGQQPITKTTDAFDIVSFDTYYKWVKLVRVGCNFDAYGRPTDMVTFNYQTKTILNG